ncbi:MFS transporter [Methylobacterium haplocladii]|uniref:MFS transporter n=1 Tax=Methylobacterium haplocladii TaxID=1176176 RepID=A0A512IQA2_9HYPH|nr:MFS transporter [Methylobacterium haplocladii]GEO99896.1 MFS transporter [Methylobacterium haplocladii]GJD82744.1 Inner membrane metabolite transport protein YhjE [Methylobacterium haplocladii]GLS58060.1 MFS transporter [Methylobacterium haplocladii]
MPPSATRILVASFVGTAIEFYDFYIYATAAALVIGPIFFPPGDPAAQTLQAFATFAIAFVARPVGAALFGHFGDRVGRKATLVASLMIMGMSTVGIGCLPSYASIGWLAPALLCLLRVGQGIGFGGEWGGAALLAVENAPPGRRALYGIAPQLGAPMGFLAANLLFLGLNSSLTSEDFAAWGWRLPFLASSVLVGVGLYVRLKLTETPAFAAALAKAAPERVPLVAMATHHWRATLLGTLAMVAPYAVFYLCTVFALSWGTGRLGYPKTMFLLFECAAILFMALAIPLAGVAADRFGRKPVLLSGLAVTAALGAVFGPMLGSGEGAQVLAVLCLGLFAMGWIFGPMGAALPELFPVRVRYTGASVTYNFAGILGASGAPFAAQWLADRGGIGSVGLYLAGAAAISFFAVALMPETGPAEV